MIAYVTQEAEQQLITSGIVRTVHSQSIVTESFLFLSQEEKFGLLMWNDAFVNTVELQPDFFQNPSFAFKNSSPRIDESSRATFSPNPMLGSNVVGIVFAESDGTQDAKSESWSFEKMRSVIQQIYKGLDWWAHAGGYRADLSWTYDIRLCATPYEPISRPKYESALWVTDCMKRLGFMAGTDIERTRQYNEQLKARYSTDHSFVIMAVSAANDSDGYFAQQSGTAWAFVGGPYMVISDKSGSWGPYGLWKVVAHETGHIFNAKDEYDPEYEKNMLASNSLNDAANVPMKDPCLMKSNDPILCEETLAQIGWKDSDEDGIFDADTANKKAHFHVAERKEEAQVPAKSVLLFYEDFSENKGWYEDINNNVSDGRYRMYDPNLGNSSWLERSYDDFTASVRVRWTDGSLSNGYGLMVRAKTASDGYFFFINQNGNFAFGKYVNAEWKYLVPWTSSASINPDLENTLKVSCKGNLYTLFINNEQVAQTADDTFVYGYVGLTVLPDVHVQFDELSVYSP